MNFTVEEINLVAIYKADTSAATLARITAAFSEMDTDMQIIAKNAQRKIAALSEPEFAALSFAPADDTDEG
jgi:hypothetical protein